MFSLIIFIQGSALDLGLEAPTTPSSAIAVPLTIQNAQSITSQIKSLFAHLGHVVDSDGMRMYFSLLFDHPSLCPQNIEHGLHATIFDSESGLSPIIVLNFLHSILSAYETYTSMPPLPFFVDLTTGKIQTLDASRCLASDHTLNCRLNEHNGIHPFMNNILAAIITHLNGEYNCMNTPFLHVAQSVQSQFNILASSHTQVHLPIEGLCFTFETLVGKVTFKFKFNAGIWSIYQSHEITNPLRNPVDTFKRIEGVVEDSENKINTLRRIEYYLAYRKSGTFDSDEFYLMIQPEVSNEELKFIIGLPVDQVFIEMEKIKAELEGMGYHHTQNIQKEFALVGDCENPNRPQRFDPMKRWNAIKDWYGRISLAAVISYEDEFDIFCQIMEDYVEDQYKDDSQVILDEEMEELKTILETFNRTYPKSPLRRHLGPKIGDCNLALQRSPLRLRSTNTHHPIEKRAGKSLTPPQLGAFTYLYMSQGILPTADPTVRRLFEDLLSPTILPIRCS